MKKKRDIMDTRCIHKTLLKNGTEQVIADQYCPSTATTETGISKTRFAVYYLSSNWIE